MLSQPTRRIATLAAIVSSRGLALDDINKEGHIKKVGDNPGLFIFGSPRRGSDPSLDDEVPET